MKKIVAVLVLVALMALNGCSKPVKKVVVPSENKQTAVEAPKEEESTNSQKSQEEPKETAKETTKDSVTNNTDSKPVEEKPKTDAANADIPTSGYFVEVDISEQKVYVFKDGSEVRTMVCSTGIPGSKDTETPTGRFKINESGKKRGEWFFSKQYKEGAKYWVGFIGGEFLFHSVPMDENQNIIEEEAKKLGQPASHGCIRMSVDDAYWFYKTIPSGTDLLIQE